MDQEHHFPRTINLKSANLAIVTWEASQTFAQLAHWPARFAQCITLLHPTT